MATTEISINLQDYLYSLLPLELFDFWAVVDVEDNTRGRRAVKSLRAQLGIEIEDESVDKFAQSILEEVRRAGEIDSLLCELFRRGASSVTLVGVPSGLSGGGI